GGNCCRVAAAYIAGVGAEYYGWACGAGGVVCGGGVAVPAGGAGGGKAFLRGRGEGKTQRAQRTQRLQRTQRFRHGAVALILRPWCGGVFCLGAGRGGQATPRSNAAISPLRATRSGRDDKGGWACALR